MIITKIELQKKNKNRYNLYLDDEFRTGIHEDVLVYYNLHVKMEIDDEFYNEILRKEIFAKAKNEAVHFISYRLRSTMEIRNKMKSNEYEDSIIDEVIEFLEQYNFIDDYNFAKAFIYDKSTIAKHSLKKISIDLKHKGIQNDIIQKALDHYIDEGFDFESDTLAHLVGKKYKQYENKGKFTTYEVTQKVIQYFYQKGFGIDKVKLALNDYKESED